MNFIEKCYDLFMRTSKKHDLEKDIKNYNKASDYLKKFYHSKRKDIEDFIVEVRKDNPITSVKQQLIKIVVSGKPPKRLDQLTSNELYYELYHERYDIILKCAYDSIKLLNELTEEQDIDLAQRLVNGDETIFTEYNCM